MSRARIISPGASVARIFASSLGPRIMLAPEGTEGAGGAAQGAAAQGGAATTGAAQGAAAAAAGAGGGAQAFYAGYGLDEASSTYLAGKNFADPKALVSSLMTFDRQARERNVLPAPDPAKIDEWEGWEKLGWPKDAAKYQVKPGKPTEHMKNGEPVEAMQKKFAELAHGARVPLAAAQKMWDGLFGFMGERLAADVKAQTTAQAQAQAKTQSDLAELTTALKGQWGADFDKKVALGQRVAPTLEKMGKLNAGDVASIAEALPAPTLMRLMAAVGEAVGEDNLVTGDGAGGMMSANQAQAELDRIDADPATKAILKAGRGDARYAELMQKRRALAGAIARKA